MAPPVPSSRKPLGRTGLQVSPFGLAESEIVGSATGSYGRPIADWCYLSAENMARVVTLPLGVTVVASIGPAAWDRSMASVCQHFMATLRLSFIDVCQLNSCDRERIKAGEPFRRLQELRDRGWVRFFGIAVASPRDASWVMDNTPAHVLTIDADIAQADWSEVWPSAVEMEVGLLATARAVGGDPARSRDLLANTPVAGVAWPLA